MYELEFRETKHVRKLFFMNLFLDILKYHNYEPVKIQEYKKGSLEIKKVNPILYVLYVDGVQWMTYNYYTHEQAFEFLSQYTIARGHCICTGLGFGIRESWLLNNKNVSKITVIEKNKCVIDYHKEINPEFMNKIEVIHSDCEEYTGECDTLLLDHYEFEESYDILQNANKICSNIKCNTMFLWPMERLLIERKRYNPHYSYLKIYNEIKETYSLNKLPCFDDETINKFIQAVRIKELL